MISDLWKLTLMQAWPVGQAVKTAASHAVNVGSIPARVTSLELHESAIPLYSSIAQSVEHAAVNRSVVGSSPTGGAKSMRQVWRMLE